jgi:deubiquitinating protein VCIP135
MFAGMMGIAPDQVVRQTFCAVSEQRLFRCLVCEALMECTIDPGILLPGGSLYDLAVKIHGELNPTKKYSFPTHGKTLDIIDLFF